MKRSTLEKIKEILKGIDKTETEHSSGWWPTSTGARFGKSVLRQIEALWEKDDSEQS